MTEQQKLSAALAAIFIGLASYIFFVERDTLSSTEVEGGQGQVFSRFVQDRLTRLTIEREGHETLVFEKVEDDEPTSVLATYRIAEPLDAAADAESVDSLIGAIRWLTAQRSLVEISDADRESFGLNAPRYVVRALVGGEAQVLRVGGNAPTGGVYVALDGDSGAHIVGLDFLEALDHDVEHFRDHQLFANLYPEHTESVLWRSDAVFAEFEKDGRWNLGGEREGWANQGLISEMLRSLRALRAERFLSESIEGVDLNEHGLSEPAIEIEARREEGENGLERVRIRVGGSCESEGERTLLVGDSGPLVCVRESDLRAFALEESNLREERLLTIGDDRVARITLARGPAPQLILRRDEAHWVLEEAGRSVDANDHAIAELMDALRALRVIESRPRGEGGAIEATISIRHTDDDEVDELQVLAGGSDGIWVRRGDEPLEVKVAEALRERLAMPSYVYRGLSLFSSCEAEAVSSLRLGGEVTQEATRQESSWTLTQPPGVPTDPHSLSAIVTLLCGLQARSYVAASAERAHGLNPPRASLSFEARGSTHILHIGAATEGGAFAQVDDHAIAIIAQRDVDELLRPWVSVEALALGEDNSRIELSGPEGGVTLHPGSDSWDSEEAARFEGWTTALSALRAHVPLRYSAPEDAAPEDGAAQSSPLTVRAFDANGQDSTVLTFWRNEGRIEAARSDMAVVFEIRPANPSPMHGLLQHFGLVSADAP